MNISPELAELLERRRVLDDAMVRTSTIADELESAVRRGEPSAVARKDELPQLRAAETAAENAADQVMAAIASFPSRTVADVAAKMRIIATEIRAVQLGPGAASAGDIEEAFIRGAAVDLNRLAAF